MPFNSLINVWKGFWGTDAPAQDGYGQSVMDDLRSARRFRRLRKLPIIWQAPDQWPGDIDADFPILDRFGDGVIAWHQADTETWIIIDRLWHGWPDPPEYAWLVFDQEGQIIAGYDFDTWPKAWARSSNAPQ